MSTQMDFLYLGFIFLNEKKELHRNNFKLCNTQSHLKLCNRVIVLNPLSENDFAEIKQFFGDYPFSYWLLLTEPKISTWLQESPLKKLIEFPLLSLSLENIFVENVVKDLEIVELQKKEDVLSTWVSVCAKGYNINAQEFQRFVNYFINSAVYPNMHFTVANFQGEPVATCLWIDRGNIADIHWICTLPAFRSKGIGRAITSHALNKINKNKEAILYSSAAGYALYTSMGFKQVKIMSVYEI